MRSVQNVPSVAGIVLAGALLGLLASPAAAQNLGAPPGTLVPPGSPLPRVLPPSAPSVVPTMPTPPPAAPAAVPNATLTLASVAVEGVTAYKPATIAALAAGLTGPAVPLSAIEAARLAILQRYRGDGYVLSTVAASIDGTALRFIVTEGRIASVKLSQDIGPAGVQVLRFLKRLTETAPIDEATLERYLLLAQDVPGITLHAVLQPSTEEPGALNLIAEVSRQAVGGLLTTDNYSSTYTGPIESLAVIDFNSFTQFGEQTQVSLYHTWPNSQTFGQASEEAFIGSSGLKLKVYGGTGQVAPTGALAAEGYFGTTDVFGAVLTYPLIRSRIQTLNLVGSFDALEEQITTLSNGTRGRASFDSLRVARIGADYARSDLLLGGIREAVNSASVRLSQGLSLFGASPSFAADAPRVGEQTNFFKASAQLSRTQTVFAPWDQATVAVMGLLAGQYSPNVLPPAEQFYLGGLEFNRGYYSGEVTGDKAVAATAELQLNTPVDLGRFGLSAPVPTQFYAFYDWGETWQNDKPALAVHIASVGGGVRITATRRIEIDMTGLSRLNRYPAGAGSSIKPLGSTAFLWRALARF